MAHITNEALHYRPWHVVQWHTLNCLPIGLGKLRGYHLAVLYSVILCLFGLEPIMETMLVLEGHSLFSGTVIVTTIAIDEPLSRSLLISSQFGTREQAHEERVRLPSSKR
jgi:hypothetical protein